MLLLFDTLVVCGLVNQNQVSKKKQKKKKKKTKKKQKKNKTNKQTNKEKKTAFSI